MTDTTFTTATETSANFCDTDITFSPIVGEGAAAHRIARVGDAFTFDVPCSDNEPRIRDLDLAEKLGYGDRKHNIRNLIKSIFGQNPNRFGVFCVAKQTSAKGGRPATEYWLTEAQALKVIAKSETPTADKLLDQMIAVVMLVRRGLMRMSANDELAADVASLKVQTAANTQAIADLTKLVATTLGDFGKALTSVVSDVAAMRAHQHGAVIAADASMGPFIGDIDAQRFFLGQRKRDVRAFVARLAPGSKAVQRAMFRKLCNQIDAFVRRQMGLGNMPFGRLPRHRLAEAINAFSEATRLLTMGSPHLLTGETFEQPSLFDQHDLTPRRKAAGSPN